MKNTSPVCIVLAAGLGLAPLAARADLALAKARNCMACHTVERKVVGPAFKAIAGKYAGKPDMVDALARKIRQGGGGVWGPVPMPANPQVNEADAKKLAGWILALPQ
ncbi:c-type cytochrome [Xylophilus sp. GOD-11R]|uniref:c-type cytochrome n=1 Tax=Xylophilus sp. GOD-11R TaxID=3089814 RepID=UPI00298D5699|nr:c-type cytochrome [Xylophilus sp. GOD-11R]WPB58545.1 c-type cytochrome [Xylophilus sp. GOD-11R]